MFSYIAGNRSESNTTRIFRRVRPVAAAGAKSVRIRLILLTREEDRNQAMQYRILLFIPAVSETPHQSRQHYFVGPLRARRINPSLSVTRAFLLQRLIVADALSTDGQLQTRGEGSFITDCECDCN